MSLFVSVGTVLISQFSPGFGTEASVPVVHGSGSWYLNSGYYFSIPRFRYTVFRVFSNFCYFGAGLVLCFSIISVLNQVELEASVLEPKLTGTLTAQNFRYQNTEVAVLSVLLVLAQNYFFIVFRIVPLITVRKYVRKP